MNDDDKKFAGLGFYQPETSEAVAELSEGQTQVIEGKIAEIVRLVTNKDATNNCTSERVGEIIAAVKKIKTDLSNDSVIIDPDSINQQLDDIIDQFKPKVEVPVEVSPPEAPSAPVFSLDDDVDHGQLPVDQPLPSLEPIAPKSPENPENIAPTSNEKIATESKPEEALTRVDELEQNIVARYEHEKAALLTEQKGLADRMAQIDRDFKDRMARFAAGKQKLLTDLRSLEESLK